MTVAVTARCPMAACTVILLDACQMAMQEGTFVKNRDKLVQINQCDPCVLALCKLRTRFVPVCLWGVLWHVHVSKVHDASICVWFQILWDSTAIAVLPDVELVHTNVSMVSNKPLDILCVFVFHQTAYCDCALPLSLERFQISVGSAHHALQAPHSASMKEHEMGVVLSHCGED
jgi:hypothetical protein